MSRITYPGVGYCKVIEPTRAECFRIRDGKAFNSEWIVEGRRLTVMSDDTPGFHLFDKSLFTPCKHSSFGDGRILVVPTNCIQQIHE